MRLSELLSELEKKADSNKQKAFARNQGSKARRVFENRANGIKYTITLIRDITDKETRSKIMAYGKDKKK